MPLIILGMLYGYGDPAYVHFGIYPELGALWRLYRGSSQKSVFHKLILINMGEEG